MGDRECQRDEIVGEKRQETWKIRIVKKKAREWKIFFFKAI